MGSFSQAEALLQARIKSEWPLKRPDVKLLWQNDDLIIPALPFVHVMIIGEHEDIAAYGAGIGRNELLIDGRVEARFFVPIKSGTELARALRDDFCSILRYWRSGGVTCRGASPLEGGTAADRGNAYFVTAVVDFEFRHKG